MCFVLCTVAQEPVWSDKMEFSPEMWEAAGKTVELKCPVDGYPPPKISWFKDDYPINKPDDRPVGAVI
jgi:Immunoglobulin I-set domain